MRIESSLACAVAVAWAGLLAPASAQSDPPPTDPAAPAEPSLEELGQMQVESIYSASKYEQKVTKAPASISVITRDEILRFGHRNVADVLDSVRGMSINNDRNYSYFGLRGFLRPGDYTTRVLVMIDGHRMNENLFDSGTLGPDAYIDIDNIERIEVVRGPGSALYGNNAFFGVINIVTRSGAQIDGGEASAETASYDTYKGRLTYGHKFKNDLDLSLSGSLLSSEGNDRLYYKEFNGYALNSDEEKTEYLFGSLRYHELTLEGNYYYRIKNIPTASFNTVFNDGRETTRDRRSFVELRYETPPEAETGVMAKVAYDEYLYRGIFPYDRGLGAPVLNSENGDGRWISPEINLRRTFWDRLTGVVGADARFNIQQHLLTYDQDPYDLQLNYDQPRHNFGTFGQLDYQIRDDLDIVGGLRYDYFQGVGGDLNPRAGIIYSPTKLTTLKLLYGEAFRAPNAYELTFNLSKPTPSNRLNPEKIRTYEAVLEQYFGKNYRASLSAYRFEVRDMISQQASPGLLGDFVYANADSVAGNGIETEFEARFSHGVVARASYAVQRAEDANGLEISNSPGHLVKAGLIFPLLNEKLFSGIEMHYASRALTLTRQQASALTVVNWTLYAHELLPRLDISFGVYNLFDEHYGYPGGEDHTQDVIAQDGRSFRAKLTYRF